MMMRGRQAVRLSSEIFDVNSFLRIAQSSFAACTSCIDIAQFSTGTGSSSQQAYCSGCAYDHASRKWPRVTTNPGRALRPSFARQFHASHSAFNDSETPEKLSDEEKQRIHQSLETLIASAMEHFNNNRPDLSEEMLEQGSQLISQEPGLGRQCTEYVQMELMLALVLHLAGSYEKCAQVCKRLLPIADKVPDDPTQVPSALLRLGCAELALGNVQEAADALTAATEILEERHGEAGVSALLPETMFYVALVHLYDAGSRAEVKACENNLLQATSAIRDLLGADNPMAVAAVHAHSKLLFRRLDRGDSDIADELFLQLAVVHRAMGYSERDLALVQYQHGTWLYSDGHSQRARDVVQDSLEALERSTPSEEDVTDDAGAQQSHEHEVMLRKHRIAVIDTVMVLEGDVSNSPSLASDTQSSLSTLSTHYADLLGKDNALTAEARFALGMWGVIDGLDVEPSKKKQLEKNLTQCLKGMAKALPGGLKHILVQRLQKVYEQRFGELQLTDEEKAALAE